MIDADWRKRLRRLLLRDGQVWTVLAFAFVLCAGSGTVFLTSGGETAPLPEPSATASVFLESAPASANSSDPAAPGTPAAQPEKAGEWLATECFGCWNCVGSCSNQGLDFKWFPPAMKTSSGSVDLGKRRILASGVGGLAALSMMRITPAANAKIFNPALIRPPGARA